MYECMSVCVYVCMHVCMYVCPPTPAVAGERVREATPLELLGSRRSESDVWQSGLRAAGPIRPSLPWCFSSAAPPLDPSCARRKQARWQPAVQEGEQKLVSSRFSK